MVFFSLGHHEIRPSRGHRAHLWQTLGHRIKGSLLCSSCSHLVARGSLLHHRFSSNEWPRGGRRCAVDSIGHRRFYFRRLLFERITHQQQQKNVRSPTRNHWIKIVRRRRKRYGIIVIVGRFQRVSTFWGLFHLVLYYFWWFVCCVWVSGLVVRCHAWLFISLLLD